MKRIIEYFGGEKRFYIILITLIIMWLVLMGFLYLKADEVTKHPCSVCANRLQEAVTCRAGTSLISERTFYPNFDINDSLGFK